MNQYDELLPYFLHYYYCSGMIKNEEKDYSDKTATRNVAEYYPYIFQEEPSIVNYYIEYCNAPLQDMIEAINVFQNIEFIEYITQRIIDKMDEELLTKFIDLFSNLSGYASLLSAIEKLVLNYDRKFELCQMISQCVEKKNLFKIESFGISIDENMATLSDEAIEKSKPLWKFIGLSCCLGLHTQYRKYFDAIIDANQKPIASLSNLIAQCSLSGGTTIFVHYLRYMTSPIAFLNSIFAAGGKKDENELYNIFHTQYLKNGNPFLLLHLVNLLRSLGTAAKKHPTEASDINDVIRKVEAMIAEIFACNIFDDPKHVLRLLSPNAKSILTGIEAFSSDAVIPICLSCNITAVFDKPQVNNIIQQLFYHRDGRYVDIRYFQQSPFSLYWNVVKLLNSDNEIGNTNTFLFDDDYFTASFWVRGCPMVNMFVDFIVKCLLLWLLAAVVIYDYGAAFGIDYSTMVIADDDAKSTILHSISNIEFSLAVFSLADLLFEIGQFIEQDFKVWKEVVSYFTASWNRLDMICAAGFMVWFFLRFTVSFEYFNVARVVLTLNAIPLSFGLLRYVSVYQPLGELVLLIRGMASQIISFFVVYAICILGFGITFYGLFYELNDSYSTAGYTFITLLQNTLVNFDFTVFRTNSNVVNILGMFLLTAFLIFTAIILMNLLIAQMSNTYQIIKEKATRKWSIGFAELVCDYVLMKERHVFCMLPPPLNIITIAIAPIHYYVVYNYQFSIGGTIANMLYDSIVGGLIRLPRQIISVLTYFRRLLVACWLPPMKKVFKSKKNKLFIKRLSIFLFRKIPYCLLMTLWIILRIVFHMIFMLLDILWVPTCMIYYAIVTPIVCFCFPTPKNLESKSPTSTTTASISAAATVTTTNKLEMQKSIMLENVYFFAVRLHPNGNIQRMYEEVEYMHYVNKLEKSKYALPTFNQEEIESILRPLKSYWKPVTNDDLSRLQQNMIHETKNLLDQGIRGETVIPPIPSSAVDELKAEISELKTETMELKEKLIKMEENHETVVSMLKELLNKQQINH